MDLHSILSAIRPAMYTTLDNRYGNGSVSERHLALNLEDGIVFCPSGLI